METSMHINMVVMNMALSVRFIWLDRWLPGLARPPKKKNTVHERMNIH